MEINRFCNFFFLRFFRFSVIYYFPNKMTSFKKEVLADAVEYQRLKDATKNTNLLDLHSDYFNQNILEL